MVTANGSTSTWIRFRAKCVRWYWWNCARCRSIGKCWPHSGRKQKSKRSTTASEQTIRFVHAKSHRFIDICFSFGRLIELGKLQIRTEQRDKREDVLNPAVRKVKNKSGVVEMRPITCAECSEEYCNGRTCCDFNYDLYTRIVPKDLSKMMAANASKSLGDGAAESGKRKKKKSKSFDLSRTLHKKRNRSKSPVKTKRKWVKSENAMTVVYRLWQRLPWHLHEFVSKLCNYAKAYCCATCSNKIVITPTRVPVYELLCKRPVLYDQNGRNSRMHRHWPEAYVMLEFRHEINRFSVAVWLSLMFSVTGLVEHVTRMFGLKTILNSIEFSRVFHELNFHASHAIPANEFKCSQLPTKSLKLVNHTQIFNQTPHHATQYYRCRHRLPRAKKHHNILTSRTIIIQWPLGA